MNALINTAMTSSAYCTETLKIFLSNATLVGTHVDKEKEKTKDAEWFKSLADLVDGLDDDEGVLFNTTANDTTWQGGNGHVFAIVKVDGELLWVEGNQYDTVVFSQHSAAEWFTDITRTPPKFLDEFLVDKRELLRDWKTRASVLRAALDEADVKSILADLIKGYPRAFQKFEVKSIV
jgi:hypothetical protein